MAEQQYVKLPDGSFFPLRENEDPVNALLQAKQLYPEAFEQPKAPTPKKSGLSGALGRGLESLLSSGQTAAEAVAGSPEEAARRAIAREEKLGGKYEEQVSLDKVKKAYEEKGLLSAAGEAISQIPAALAEQAPNIGATLGGARAGAALGSLAGPVGTVVGGVAGAALPSLISQFGGNIQRQAQEQQAKGEPLDISLGAAGAAAVPQAALDVAGTFIPLGGRLISKLTGIPEQALLKNTGNAAKLAEERLSKTLLKGTAVGFAAEIPTEVTQQMLERAQAGLSLTSPDALEEYGKTAYQVGLLAPIGAAGRVSERAGARQQIAQEEKAQQARDRQQQQEQQQLLDEQARQAQIEAEAAGMASTEAQQSLPGFEAVPSQEPPPAAPEFVDYNKQIRDLENYKDDLRERVRQTTNIDEKRSIFEQAKQAEKALEEAKRLQKEQPQSTDAAIENLIARMRKAEGEGNGDFATQERIADKLEALGVKDIAVWEQQAASRQDKIPLQPFKGKSETKASFASRVYKPGAPEAEAEEQAALEQAELDRVTATQEADRERKIAPEVLALQRIAKKPTYSVGEGQISGAVDQLVESFLRPTGGITGRVVAEGGEPLNRADELRAQLAHASATSNTPLIADIREKLKALNEPETERAAGELEFGLLAKKAGIEGTQNRSVMQANRVTRLSQGQLHSFDRLSDFIQTVRESDQDVAEGKKDTLKAAVEKLKDTTVGAALNEIDARRAQAGLPELDTQKRVGAVSRLNGVLNELTNRGAGLFNVQEVPAVMRGTQIVKGAEQRRPPVGQRLFNNYQAASNSIRAQMRNIIDDVGEIKAPEAIKKAPPTRMRVKPDLYRQFAGQERSVEAQFADAKARATEADSTQIDELEQKYKNLSPEAQSIVLEQVRRVETGKKLEIPAQLQQELADIRQAGVSETGQRELFPGTSEKGITRATPGTFMRFLESGEADKLRAKLAEENRMAEFQAKRAATIQKKLEAETAKQTEIINKLVQPWFESPVTTARRQFENTVDKNIAAADAAKEIQQKRADVTARIAKMTAAIEISNTKADKNLKDVQELYDAVAQQYILSPRSKKAEVSLAYYEKELNRAKKAAASTQDALSKAEALQERVRKDFANETIDNAILREGKKAEAKIEKARQEVIKAQGEEAAAIRVLQLRKQQRVVKEKELTPAEKVAQELEPSVKSVTRVFRDTSDPATQKKVADERKNIAKWEAAHEAAETDADKEVALKNIEAAYNRTYEALNNAPQKQETYLTDAEAQADVKKHEQLEAAQDRTTNAMARLFEETAGLPAMRLSERKVEGVVRVKGAAARTAIKEPSVAQQEAAFKKEEETGEYKAKALYDLATTRSELKTINDQITYIDTHKAEPRTPARAKQNAARTKAVAERKRLEGEERRLAAVQKVVEREAKEERKAVKAVHTEKTRMVREAGRLQEAVEEKPDFEAMDVPQAQRALPANIASVSYNGNDFQTVGRDLQDVLYQVAKGVRKSLAPSIEGKIKNGVAIARAFYEHMVDVNTKPFMKAAADWAEASVRDKRRLAIAKKLDVSRLKVEINSLTDARPISVATQKLMPVQHAAKIKREFGTEIDTDSPLTGMTFADAARYGARKTTSPMARQLFDRLADVFDSAPVREGDGRVYATVSALQRNGKSIGGLYISASDAVYVQAHRTGHYTTNKVLLHELTHAATVRAMELDRSLRGRMESLRQQTLDWLATPEGKTYFRKHRMGLGRTPKDIYGLKNDKEFVAELFANREFQKLLVEIPSTQPRKSIFTRFVEALSKFFDMPAKAAQSLFAEAVALTEEIFNVTKTEIYEGKTPEGGFSKGFAPMEITPIMDDLIGKAIQQPKTWREKLGTNPKLEAEMQGVDMRAGLRETLKHGDDLLFKQAMYNVLKADQKMPVTFAVLNNGALELSRDAKGMYIVNTSGKTSGKDVFDAIADVPRETSREKVDVATMYMLAQRALNKGVSKLDIGALGITEDKLRAALKEVDADPKLKTALEHVRNTYNKYNEGLIRFLAQAQRITKAQADALLETGDYVPFYRVKDNGAAELVYGDDLIVSVGDIRYQPYLAELKGGQDKIIPLDQSLYRNTLLLTDAALSNMATKSIGYALQALGKGAGDVDPKTGARKNKMAIHSGAGPEDANVIRFYSEPDPNKASDDGRRWVKIDTEGTVAEGVPAALVVKSIEGSHLPLPAFLKIAGAFSDTLRSGITRMPPYILRQLVRDPMAAAFTSGFNYGPIRAMVKAGTEFVKQYRGTSTSADALIKKGLIQSGIFTGDADDIAKIALQISSGKDKSVLDKVFAALDNAAIKADASTRALVYENALKNGLSEGEADIMTMESMNFYKRGLNPAVQYANRLIPFINSQIQGLNVLYKAARGQMPFEEQLKIQRKFFNNAMFLMGLGFVYALAMDDDEYYKNARPRDKYTNFFLHLPGVAEPVKMPIPYEAGYFFAIPVALVDALKKDKYTPEQWEAVRDMFLNSIPGWTSRGAPQIIKPVYEVWTNKNFMSGAPIESMRQQGMDITERFNANTTEFAKAVSKALPILSPVQIEHLTRAYLGVAPLVAFSAANQLFKPESKGEAPEMRASELPFFGSMFQKQFGGADADTVYRLAKESVEARTTFNRMIKEGRSEDAKAFREDHKAEIASAGLAGQYRKVIGQINLDMERTRNRGDLSAEQKRARLDQLEKAKQEKADLFIRRFNVFESRV